MSPLPTRDTIIDVLAHYDWAQAEDPRLSAAHAEHRYDGRCALCRNDVARLADTLTQALAAPAPSRPALAEQLATVLDADQTEAVLALLGPAAVATAAADLDGIVGHFIFDVLDGATAPNPHHRKALKEAAEFHDEPSLEEAADVFICLIAWALREGHGLADIIAAAEAKMTVNLARTWVKQADGTHQHADDAAEASR